MIKLMPARGGSLPAGQAGAFGGDFKKDLLLVDLEMTGLDVNKHEIIQLAALLLDKKTLKEKAFFNSYIRPKKWENRDRVSMKINGIKKKWLESAPDSKTVLKNFNKKFNPKKVILSYYGGPADMDFLRSAYHQTGLKWNFDYHYFNLWALFYSYLAKKNQLHNNKKFAGFGLEDLMKRFKIKSFSRHDALTDCRIEADILRRVIKEI